MSRTNKGSFSKLFLSSLVGFSFLAVVTGTVAWFVGGGLQSDKHADGEIGLRSYFYSGDGLTESTAYEITTPTHMYNLSMLQNIGLFPEKRYFRVGHFDEQSGEYKVIVGYDSNGEPLWGDELNMSGTAIAPIGNEGTPFMGDFDGKGIPIVDQVVKGNPEDIGFFGYIGYLGDVTGLILKNATIESLGYNSTSTNKQYQLFNPEIEDLYFNSSKYFEKFTKVKFYGFNHSTNSRDNGTVLTNANGLGGSTYSNLNIEGNNLITIGEESDEKYIYNGYFDIKFPNDYLNDPDASMTSEERSLIQNDPFTYHWLASTPLIENETCISVDGDQTLDTVPMIDLTKLINADDAEERDFNYPGVNSKVTTRLYLYATVEYKNFTYSRVIQAYSIEIFSNKDKENTGYSMAMYCDYVATADAQHTVTNYHHGNNIGFLAGHLDGNMTQCYVYGNNNGVDEHGAHLIFNNETGMCPIATTSDIGLIGEVGEGVYNKIDPDIGVLPNGDIGVMNFTKIYTGIRRNFNNNESIKAGHIASPLANYVCYNKAKNTSSTSLFNNYEPYLRYSTVKGTKQYLSGVGYTIDSVDESEIDPSQGEDVSMWHNYKVTNSLVNSHPELNSVDFLWNSLIQDEDGVDRGLGVFKIATINDGNTLNPNSLDMYKNMGKSAIDGYPVS